MKNILFITYDLVSPGRDYPNLLKRIKKFPRWAKICESSFLISTNKSPEAVRNYLAEVMDENDKIFVGIANAPAAWAGQSERVSSWILNNLK